MNATTDDALLTALGRGEHPTTEPLAVILAAWRKDIHGPPIASTFDRVVLIEHEIALADRPLGHRVLVYALAAWILAITLLALYFLP